MKGCKTGDINVHYCHSLTAGPSILQPTQIIYLARVWIFADHKLFLLNIKDVKTSGKSSCQSLEDKRFLLIA